MDVGRDLNQQMPVSNSSSNSSTESAAEVSPGAGIKTTREERHARRKAGGWRAFASRFSGRGRIRSVFLLAALVFSVWNPIPAAVGAAVFLSGALLHAIAKGNLVRNTQLCQSGPYGWVRHPFYVANFLIDLGLCLMAGLPWLGLLYVFLFPLAYLPRIFAEEEALREHFGPTFDDYCRKTPRLFPRAFPHPFAWLRETSYENLRRENELSRLVRLCGYPFFITAVILGKTIWHEHIHVESLVACAAAVSLALWGAGELIHTQVEDGKPLDGAILRILPFVWLLLSLLPLLRHRQPAWLEFVPHESDIFYAGCALCAAGAIGILLTLRRSASGTHSFGLTLVALGCGLLSGQIVLAPLLAFLIWADWFTASVPRFKWLAGVALALFLICLAANR